MKHLGLLVGVLDHLNKLGSAVFIEHFNEETGQITLSNNTELNIDELKEVKDIESYIGSEVNVNND